MTAPRQSPEIRARQLLDKYYQSEPAIDVELIARGEGAQIIRDALDSDVSGVLLRSGKSTTIVVNEKHHLRRQRFTIAHEIGHLVMHPGRAYTVDPTIRLNWRNDLSGLATDKEEIQANKFAAALLMPDRLIRSSLLQYSTAGLFGDERVLDRLARAFDVSSEAMNFRLINLGIAI